ncbi:hypothetical protein L4D06_06265 [Enterovibrio makurazakiensis]|uniref:hypothetical protein n=1 Tax=Enterovibrio makurazakiensis TaxID=2910232 RepID=UPI003D215555
MSQHYVFVKKGKIRDFDDIYEGMIPDPIMSSDDMKSLLSNEFQIDAWEIFEKRKLIGKNSAKHIEVTIDAVGDKTARMITINGIDKESAISFAEKLDLSELE